MNKEMMVVVTQLLGSSWSPKRTKPRMAILQDVPPSDGDDSGRSNKGEAVVTSEISSSI